MKGEEWTAAPIASETESMGVAVREGESAAEEELVPFDVRVPLGAGRADAVGRCT